MNGVELAKVGMQILHNGNYRYMWDKEMPKEAWDFDNHLRQDYWQTPDETNKRRGGDCDDFGIWLIDYLASHGCRDVMRLCAGRVPQGNHVWVEIITEENRFWCDPTPGWGRIIEPAQWFMDKDRRAVYGYTWNGEGFDDEVVYSYDSIDAELHKSVGG